MLPLLYSVNIYKRGLKSLFRLFSAHAHSMFLNRNTSASTHLVRDGLDSAHHQGTTDSERLRNSVSIIVRLVHLYRLSVISRNRHLTCIHKSIVITSSK